MFTLLTLALWIGGLATMLAGPMLLGAAIAAAGVPCAVRALRTPDDLETAAGLALAVGAVGAVLKVLAFIAARLP